MFDPVYVQQAKLLLQCIPEIGKHPCFALKGGTAINLFLRSMPKNTKGSALRIKSIVAQAASWRWRRNWASRRV